MILLDNSFWEIKQTEEKGRGIFARKEISAGIVISDYIGKVIKIAEEDTSEKDGLYLLYYHDYAAIYPEDLQQTGAHMLNHSCEPNCWIYTYKGHTLFFALRKILPGEELTISYQLSPDKYCKPCSHICICHTPTCTGSMHLTQKQFDVWNTFHEKESKKTKRARIRYGKLLVKLNDYPKMIEDNSVYTLFGNRNHPTILPGKKVPTAQTTREKIRTTGRTLLLPALGLHIVGVKENRIVSERV